MRRTTREGQGKAVRDIARQQKVCGSSCNTDDAREGTNASH